MTECLFADTVGTLLMNDCRRDVFLKNSIKYHSLKTMPKSTTLLYYRCSIKRTGNCLDRKIFICSILSKHNFQSIDLEIDVRSQVKTLYNAVDLIKDWLVNLAPSVTHWWSWRQCENCNFTRTFLSLLVCSIFHPHSMWRLGVYA